MPSSPELRQVYLGALDELTVMESKEFQFQAAGLDLFIFTVRYQGKIYAYLNRCPHMGVALNWDADKFLDLSKTMIICSTHGALFRIEDGLCVWGPCVHQSLTAITLEQVAGRLYVNLPPAIAAGD